MFDHVQIKVKDLKRSQVFYQSVLKTLGYEVVLEEVGVVGFGNDPHNMFEVCQFDSKTPLSEHVHVAFTARSEREVHDFYNTAIAHGAKGNGEPGLRPEYEEGYFAAFVIDPNGHNLEVVFKRV